MLMKSWNIHRKSKNWKVRRKKPFGDMSLQCCLEAKVWLLCLFWILWWFKCLCDPTADWPGRGTGGPASVPGVSLLSTGKWGQSRSCGSHLFARCSRGGLYWHTSQTPQGAWWSLSRYTRKECQKRRHPRNYHISLQQEGGQGVSQGEKSARHH